jgi:predicted Zn-dependent protease
VLSLAPGNHAARLCRAIAYSGADQLEPARGDYQQLLNNSSNAPNALFGLGTIAWRQRDTNTAIQFYQRYLSTCTPESPRLQYASAFERLRQLKGEQKDGGR